MPENPFGLSITPEPSLKIPAHQDWDAEVVIQAGDFFPAHYHEPGPKGKYDRSNSETYCWISGGPLTIYIQQPGELRWRTILLYARNPIVTILAGIHHGGVASGNEAVVFRALSRADHFWRPEQGGNTHRLSDTQQPAKIQNIMRIRRRM